MSKNLFRHIVLFAGLVLFLILAIGCGDTNTDTIKVQYKSADYILSANQLYSEYNSNAVAADLKYKGKVVIVSGKVQSIGKDVMGYPYIVIGDGGFLDVVQCTFSMSEEASIASLSKGQSVRVKGEVSGKILLVIVRNCSLK